MFKDNKNCLKIFSRKLISLFILSTILGTFITPVKSFAVSINKEKTEDTYLYYTTDSIITTKTGLKRTIPETFGKYDRSVYPIPEVQTCTAEMFPLIQEENLEIMKDLETKIANGTLKKHISADGQYYGTVPADATAVEKIAYLNTNLSGTHSLGVFIPAGEIATITIPQEYLSYFTNKYMSIVVGMPTGRKGESLNATDYSKGGKSRMPYLDYTFNPTETEIKVGTPLGGMIYVQMATNIPMGLEIPITVSGAVDTPYYDLGRTTKEEWEVARNAPGLYAELRTPYQRFAVPASQVRNIEDPKDILTYWFNVAATSTYAFGNTYRTLPISMVFDTYVPAGAAVAFVGRWFCVCPTSWAGGTLNYNTITQSGGWGAMHEFNHHWQGVYNTNGGWGVGSTGEVTNNVMNVASYLLYTNIACNRSETYNLGGWEKSTDPYYNLTTAISDWENRTEPNTELYMYATFMHEFGVENFLEVVKSNYYGGTYNNINISSYQAGTSRYDDLAYRMCVIFGKDLTMYIQEVLKWQLSYETVQKIKAHGFEQYIPVQNLYASGVKGVETGRPFFMPVVDSHTFDFEKYTKTSGEIVKIEVGNPKYGKIVKQQDGTYLYKPNYTTIKDDYDEFDLKITVRQNGIINERTLLVKIGFNYQTSKLEKYEIQSRDLEPSINEAKNLTPYAVAYSNSVNYTPDNGINLTKGIGYIEVPKDGEYEFQAYGDDKVKFILNVNGTKHSSATSTYITNVISAYEHAGSTHFTVSLKAGQLYPYEFYCYNNGGPGSAYVAYRQVGTQTFTNLLPPYLYKEDYGKENKKVKVQPENPTYIRKLQTISNKKKVDITGAEVISTPRAQSGGAQEATAILDGNYNTFFHSAYTGSITPFPHEYVIDLKEKKEYNQIDIYTRSSNTNGTIGDYELYISNDNQNWTKIAEDNERKGSNKSNTISVTLDKVVKARYFKIVAKNNKNGNKFTIISEVEFAMQSNSNNQIAQNSSKINYIGNWDKDVNGLYINGATYVSQNGTFQYAIEGTSTMIYSTTDAKIKIQIDDNEWEEYEIVGSKKIPSIIIRDLENGKHNIQVQVVDGKLSLNLLATDGTFTTYTENPPSENPPSENPPSENPPSENPPSENPPSGNPPSENPPGGNPPSENPPGGNPPSENPPSETPPSENPPSENPPNENPNENNDESLASGEIPQTGDNVNIKIILVVAIVLIVAIYSYIRIKIIDNKEEKVKLLQTSNI